VKIPAVRQLHVTVIFLILLIGFLSWTLGLTVVYVIGKESLKERIGTNFQKIAEETGKNLASMIEGHIESANALSLSNDVRNVVEASNRLDSGARREARIARLREAWSKGAGSPEARNIMENPASDFLRSFLRSNREREEHYLILVADAEGILAASNAAPAQSYFADQQWWKAAFDEGRGSVYVSDIEETSFFAGKEKTYLLTIAVPVMDVYGTRAVGVLAMVHPVRQFFELVTQVKVARTDHTMLAGSDGNLLFCPIFLIKNHRLDKNLLKSISRGNPGWDVTYDDVHYPGRESINGFAPLKIGRHLLHPSSLGGHAWYVFTSQDPEETYAPINTLLKWTAAGGLLGIGMFAFLGYYFTRRIVKPIHALKVGTQRVSVGDLDYRISIRTGDEIEELATAFNNMAARIKEYYAGLEQKVSERTYNLERRNKELSALYAIVSTLGKSLKLDDLLNEVLRKILLIFDLSMGAIHLWDPREGTLNLKAHQGLSNSSVGRLQKIKTGEGPIGRALETGEPIFFADHGRAPEPPVSEEVKKAVPPDWEFRYVTGLPLKSKGKTLGTLTLFDRRDDTFSDQDHALLLSICSQIAVAAENARLYEEAKKVDQLKSDFVTKVSHEFRTPLTSIKGFAEILLTSEEASEFQKEFLRIILQESDRLTRLINDVLDLAKIESGRIEWHIQPVDLAEVLLSVSRSLFSVAQGKRLSLVTEVPPLLPRVNADRDQLIQVINNLLSNAIKFTPEGRITVSARRKGEQEVQISICDTGIGIPAEELPRIFEKFHQVAPSGRGTPKGTGLGLAICQEIIQRLGGKIWCESVPGEGSTFHLTLTVAQAPATLSSGLAESQRGRSNR
jgi:signal transduction histidine kinase